MAHLIPLQQSRYPCDRPVRAAGASSLALAVSGGPVHLDGQSLAAGAER
jgi:hypothetical protein